MPALEWELKSSVKKKRVDYLLRLLYTHLYNLRIVIFSYEVPSDSYNLKSIETIRWDVDINSRRRYL